MRRWYRSELEIERDAKGRGDAKRKCGALVLVIVSAGDVAGRGGDAGRATSCRVGGAGEASLHGERLGATAQRAGHGGRGGWNDSLPGRFRRREGTIEERVVDDCGGRHGRDETRNPR